VNRIRRGAADASDPQNRWSRLVKARVALPLVALAAGYAELQWLGRTYGATAAERRRRLPGDDVCPHPQAVTTHAITIDAHPSRVWPWLVQMGWGRGQWYTARWVDQLLFPNNGPSADKIIPELQALRVGDLILDGPPDKHCAFVVEQIEPNHDLVLHSVGHLPPNWSQRFGASIDWSWAFVLEPVYPGKTRFLVRSRIRLAPRWVELFYLGLIVPADFVMSRQFLKGVKVRAERSTINDEPPVVAR
jgi:hypothetical protein